MNMLTVNIMFEGVTADVSLVRHIMTALSALEPLAPNFWGRRETKREAWDLDEILKYLALSEAWWLSGKYVLPTGIELWRTKAPKYTGNVLHSARSVNSVKLYFKPSPSPKHLVLIYEAAQSLVEQLPTVFAYVQPAWQTSPELPRAEIEARNRFHFCTTANTLDLHKFGVPSVYPRTWFGPMLVERIGRDRLHAVNGTTEQDGGRIRLDLVPTPWTATLEELMPRKEAVMDQLRPSGMFMEVEWHWHERDGLYLPKESIAPKWTPPDWQMRK
jgi:hypothetical protein